MLERYRELPVHLPYGKNLPHSKEQSEQHSLGRCREVWLPIPCRNSACFSPSNGLLCSFPGSRLGSSLSFKWIWSRRRNRSLGAVRGIMDQTQLWSTSPFASCLWLSAPRRQQKPILVLAPCCLLPGEGAWPLPSAGAGSCSAALRLSPCRDKKPPCPLCRGFTAMEGSNRRWREMGGWGVPC